MNDLDKLTQAQLETLPQPLQEAIKTVSWKESIRGIGESAGLDEDKLKTLETETLLIIYCFEPQENFRENLKRELSIDEKTIDTLIKEIEDEVFSPILMMADSLDALNTPKPEALIDLPEEEVLIPEHTEENKPVLNVEPEAQHKNINLLEEKPVVENPVVVESKPIIQPVQAETSKNIVEEHLTQSVTATSKYVGGIDPYREPLV